MILATLIAATTAVSLPSLVSDLQAKTGLPAVGAIIVEDGLIRPAEVRGNARLGFNEPVNADMPWHLGSNAKAMTAALVATFVAGGRTTYGSSVLKVLEIDPGNVAPGWDKITIRDLLEQTSGLTTETYPGGFGWYEDKRPIREQRRDYTRRVLALAPVDRGKFVYANPNYVLLGAICEKLGGRDWERLIEERLFRPIGIENAGFGPCPKGGPQPHKAIDGGFSLLDVDDVTDNAPVVNPAGSIHMPLREYAKWMKAVMDESGPLTRREWRDLVTPTSIAGKYGAGWLLVRHRERARFMVHLGSNTMNIMGCWIDFERKRAIAIAANGYSDEAMKEINRVCREWATKE